MTSMHRADRRRFLRRLGHLGLGAAASPMVAGLLSRRRAYANPAGATKVVFVYTPNGAPNGLWLPQGTSLNTATAAYAGLQSVCHFREVDVVASGHGNARKSLGALRWGRDWTGDSIDQQIASVLGANSPFPSYALGVQTDANNFVSRRSGSAVPMQDAPEAAYAQLFGGTPRSGGPDAALSAKQSVLDLNRSALAELKGRLGSFERQTLESHETALGELEARLVAAASGPPPEEGCSSPTWNRRGANASGATSVPFAHTAELQSDIITAALQCGLTRVFTLQLGWHQGTWYAHDTDFRGDHHNSCHSASARENAEMTNYLSGCIAYLIRRLMETDDPAVPGTKLIDNTVVVQVSDMGDGRDHTAGNGPNLVATRMPSFRTGVATRGGTNLQVLEAVAEGLGLGAYKGTNVDQHRIWPCADGQVATDLLT